eukprot:CAMPEP_0198289422 /NCGR_PEP_ID=MMETSP1449-20131203/7600_1 /TAXON_ID=420275 /ORGANISM="Attheya septentrionalis, Strain CCMP2084" /LENGTH=308 /DNA_ID=CAMNT_0043987739 /DNA_START=46 /DNA_END=972 /DNA_ORIENTATION=-
MASSESDSRPTMSDIRLFPLTDFVGLLGGIYEHSYWVAETLFLSLAEADEEGTKKMGTIVELAAAMKQIVDNASHEKKIELLKAHPDLCEKVEALNDLTAESQVEQGRAGLQTLTDEERAHFLSLNSAYRTKFGFPFILAVRNATKYTVLASVEGRVGNSQEVEFVAALKQVHKIAWMRLLAAVRIKEPAGFLTCHVLDTANGAPAANMRILLHKLLDDGERVLVGEFFTNSDGRLPGGPALKGVDFQVGVYEWTFFAGDYFARIGTPTSGTPFLDVVPLRFGIDNPEDHYHVPLLVSPWSFSTYRGS